MKALTLGLRTGASLFQGRLCPWARFWVLFQKDKCIRDCCTDISIHLLFFIGTQLDLFPCLSYVMWSYMVQFWPMTFGWKWCLSLLLSKWWRGGVASLSSGGMEALRGSRGEWRGERERSRIPEWRGTYWVCLHWSVTWVSMGVWSQWGFGMYWGFTKLLL